MENRNVLLHQQFTPPKILDLLSTEARKAGWGGGIPVKIASVSAKWSGEVLTSYSDVDSSAQKRGMPGAANRYRDALDRRLAVVAQVTSRTAEMAVTQGVHAASARRGFARSYPKLGKDETGGRFETDSLNTPDITPWGVLNPHAGGFESGLRIFVQHIEDDEIYYREDTEYQQVLGVPDCWSERVRRVLRGFENTTGVKVPFAPIDVPGNFEKGRVDVAVPSRIQLYSENHDSLGEFLDRFAEWVETAGSRGMINEEDASLVLKDTVFVDDSKVDRKPLGYLLPQGANKGSAVVWMEEAVQGQLRRKDIIGYNRTAFAIGDSPVDLQIIDAMHYLQDNKRVDTGIVVFAGGSVLSEALSPRSEETRYSSVDLHPIKSDYEETGTTGVYRRRGKQGEALLVIGDEWRPELIGPETGTAALEEFI